MNILGMLMVYFIFQTWIGPVLVCMNGNQQAPPPLALSDSHPTGQFLKDLIHYAVRNHEDSGQSQVLVVRLGFIIFLCPGTSFMKGLLKFLCHKITVKNRKIQTAEKIAVIIQNIEQCGFTELSKRKRWNGKESRP